MRASVISLPRRADRRRQFQAWNDGRIDYDFVDAIDGRTLARDALLADGVVSANISTFNDGALGCALSHRAQWQRIAASNEPGLIIEDDACLRGDFATASTAVVNAIAGDWDFVYLGFNADANAAFESAEGLKYLVTFDEAAKREPDFFTRFATMTAPNPTPLRCFQAWGILAYVVSPAGARRLLDLCFPLRSDQMLILFGDGRAIPAYGIDGLMNRALQREELVAYCAIPPLAISPNNPNESDVAI